MRSAERGALVELDVDVRKPVRKTRRGIASAELRSVRRARARSQRSRSAYELQPGHRSGALDRWGAYLQSGDEAVAQVDREGLWIDIGDFAAVLPAHRCACLDCEVITVIVDATGNDL